jgi:hypothetical protein
MSNMEIDLEEPGVVQILSPHFLAWEQAGNNTTLRQKSAGAGASALHKYLLKEGTDAPSTPDLKRVGCIRCVLSRMLLIDIF